MRNPIMERQERGIALMLVLFTMLLLSVIGLGMMYSTNMESAINSNYRDKQTALCCASGAAGIARPYSTRDCEYRRAYRTPGIRLQRVRHCHLYCRGFNSRPDGSKQCIFRPGVL